LFDAEGVDPDVRKAELAGDVDCIFEGPRDLRGGNLLQECIMVLLSELEKGFGTPAVAEGAITWAVILPPSSCKHYPGVFIGNID
jgi:hypothetical protein